MVPEWLLDACQSPIAIKLYCHLGRFADRNTGECDPRRGRLAAAMHCSRDTVDRALKELKDAGGVSWEQRVGDDGDFTSNVYTLHRMPPPGRTDAATPGRESAATGGRTDAAHNQNQFEPEVVPNGTTRVPSAKRVDLTSPADFDRFWTTYPLHKAKAAAEKAWPKAVKAAGGVEVLIAAAERYRTELRATGAICAYPASWLNGRRWEDEPAPRTNGHARPANRFDPNANISTNTSYGQVKL